MSIIIELPQPPLSDSENCPEFYNLAVSLLLASGKKIDGSLIDFDNANAVVKITANDNSETLTVKMHEIKTMHLTDPIPWCTDPNIEQLQESGMTTPDGLQDFIITFKDQSKLRGKTYGTRVDKNGIHLFKEHNANQYMPQYIHIFIPKIAIENNIIGEQIGEILVQDNDVSRNELNEALAQQQDSRSKPLGKYLVGNKIVNPEQLEAALKRQKNMPSLKLGEILISEGLISDNQLEDALRHQKSERRKPLGEILIDKGIISREQIQQALAKKLGIPFIHLQDFKIPPETISLTPADLTFKHKVIPLYQYEGKIVVAIENPMDWEALDAMKFHTNKYIEPVMALAEDINWGLQFYYTSDDVLQSIEQTDDDDYQSDDFLSTKEEVEVTENIIVKTINKIILDAYQQGVSDIHIEPNPGREKVLVRFRKDGTLIPYHKFPPQYRNALISRIKVMARLDISERRKPQDGKINFKKFGPANIELRVATLPTTGGLEDVVMRILTSGKNIPLNALGLNVKDRDRLLEAISKPYGLFLVCGPTGSGKTTTLHSILGNLNDSQRKICTAEDPIEITQPGLRQVQINPKVDLTFAAAMRAFLRSDPDIIMVGEMRDPETARTGIEASLTGHLVLSTLHTNNSTESIIRLLDMGMDPFNFADALLGILAQRLAKTLCVSCKKAYQPDQQELEHLAHEYCMELLPSNATEAEIKQIANKQIDEWRGHYTNSNSEFTLQKASGCKECNDSGYRGRIGLHELLIATPNIKKLIVEHATPAVLNQEGLTSGMRTLKQNGIEKVLQGYTDFSQVRMVCIR